MSSWTLYWITRLDNLHPALVLCCIGLGIPLFAWTIAHVLDEYKITRLYKYLCGLLFLFIGLLIFLPTTKEMAAILVIPAIVNSEEVREFSGTAKDLADAWLKKQLEE